MLTNIWLAKQDPLKTYWHKDREFFKDGNTFYFWGAISDVLQCVDSPKDIVGILDCLRKNSGLEYHSIDDG